MSPDATMQATIRQPCTQKLALWLSCANGQKSQAAAGGVGEEGLRGAVRRLPDDVPSRVDEIRTAGGRTRAPQRAPVVPTVEWRAHDRQQTDRDQT
jgi:hypothetical protein